MAAVIERRNQWPLWPSLLILGAAIGSLLILIGLTLAPVPAEDTEPRLMPIPLPTQDGEAREGYWLAYDGRTRQPRWVLERITQRSLSGSAARTNSFRADLQIAPEFRIAGTAYDGTGYDRGHLAPADNHTQSAAKMASTFLMSNMSPQLPAFNRGLWKKLEQYVQSLAVGADEVWIVTAPLWSPDPVVDDDTDGETHTGEITIRTIGKAGVWVPTHFGKAVLIRDGPAFLCRTWIVPHRPLSDDLSLYGVSVDEFERLAGLDLWAFLPDADEQLLESMLTPFPE